MILRFQGPSALSDFRRSKLLADLRAVEPAVAELSASYVHFVETSRDLTGPEQQKLMDEFTARLT